MLDGAGGLSFVGAVVKLLFPAEVEVEVELSVLAVELA